MKQYFLCLATGILIFCACNSGSEQKSMDGLLQQPAQTGVASAGNDAAGGDKNFETDTAASPAQFIPPPTKDVFGKIATIDWDKKIIKTADISLELKDYKAFNNSIHTGLKAYGAYIAEEQQTQSDYKMANAIVVKVPVDQFDNLLNSIQGDGIKVLEKRISSEDVTGEVVDTKSRLEAKKQVREKYLELLKQARNMNEILQVQSEINDIQEQIESANGRINYLQHSAAYSTVNLTYFQYLTANGNQEDHPDFFSRMSKAFNNGGSIIVNLFLFLVTIWPLLIAGLILLLLLKKYRVKKV